ncbi:hypothetical protein [Roseibium sediminicola]|uniref:Uncharacterized protein n=1 Tax=Roseibium sediminicola TaxID=2933272 RepID=A0ABT0GPU0_9HYPH|nr:hypothetical protein [Roseibium sp. CAU 1639]MCK7611461.1 hypothetical protein [Roseibium sp. CAU 1639]
MPDFSWPEFAVAVVVLLVFAAILLAPLLSNYSEYRRRRAPYDGFKGHSGPMRILMVVVGIVGFFGWLFMTFAMNFSS